MRIFLGRTFCLLSVAAVACATSGCGGGDGGSSGSAGAEQVESASPVAASGGAREESKTTVQRVTEGVQGAVKAAEDTAAKAQEAAEESVAKAQAMLDQLKSAVSEKRLQDAGGLLEQLSGVTLDEEQKQTLAQLTEELKKVSGELEQGLGELKGLVVEQKYSEAMELVGKLGDYELSLEQETMFNNLKTQVQKMMESQAGQDAVKAVGNLLGR